MRRTISVIGLAVVLLLTAGSESPAQRGGGRGGTGPGGSFGSAYHGGVAVGPKGAAAGGTRAGTVAGPGGVASGVTRGAVGAGAYGAAAGRTTAARGVGGTYYASTTALRTTGAAV